MLRRAWIVVSSLWSLLVIVGLASKATAEYPFDWTSTLLFAALPWLAGMLILFISRYIFLGSPTAKLPIRDIRLRRSGE